MATLGDGAKITTVSTQKVVLTADNGQNFTMEMSDLAEAVRQVMPVATNEKNGLLSPSIIFDTMTLKGYILPNDKKAIDNLKETGVYNHHDSLFGTTSGHGILLVFKGGSYIAQLDISNKGILFFRFHHGSVDWSDWKQISFT